MSNNVYGDVCPVCERVIKTRPAALRWLPCAHCMEHCVTPRDRYRLKNARLTASAYADIIENAGKLYDSTQVQPDQ